MTRYTLAPDLRWAVERLSVTLTDKSGQVRSIQYPQAGIWDLVSRGYPFDRVVSLTAHIAGCDAAGADRLVRDTLDEWARAGWIVSA
jgi:hypothetical protein